MSYLHFTPLPQPTTNRSSWLKWLRSDSLPEDHKVILIEPFMKHYAGTIFDLGKPGWGSAWDPDERVREKISFNDKKVYALPDSGNGRSVELPFHYTIPFPEHLFHGLELTTGPCRITSITLFDKKGISSNPKYYPIPDGTPPLILEQDENGRKQKFVIELHTQNLPAHIKIFDVQTDEMLWQTTSFEEKCFFDGSSLKSGFYTMEISSGLYLLCRATFIKLFPVYIENDAEAGLITKPTIW